MRQLGFGFVCLAALSGCASETVAMREGPREYVATDYSTVLRQWTRSAQLTSLDAMDNVLTVTATYESWDFRWAYAIRYSEDYRLTIDQRHALLERSLAETRDQHQFYVALYAERHKWNDLTAEQPPGSAPGDEQGTETARQHPKIKSPARSRSPTSLHLDLAQRLTITFRAYAPRRATIPSEAAWFAQIRRPPGERRKIYGYARANIHLCPPSPPLNRETLYASPDSPPGTDTPPQNPDRGAHLRDPIARPETAHQPAKPGRRTARSDRPDRRQRRHSTAKPGAKPLVAIIPSAARDLALTSRTGPRSARSANPIVAETAYSNSGTRTGSRT